MARFRSGPGFWSSPGFCAQGATRLRSQWGLAGNPGVGGGLRGRISPPSSGCWQGAVPHGVERGVCVHVDRQPRVPLLLEATCVPSPVAAPWSVMRDQVVLHEEPLTSASSREGSLLSPALPGGPGQCPGSKAACAVQL